jgi:hypothetical protein
MKLYDVLVKCDKDTKINLLDEKENCIHLCTVEKILFSAFINRKLIDKNIMNVKPEMVENELTLTIIIY